MPDIVLCVNDRNGSYYKRALVTMTSVLANASAPVAVHILHDDSLLPNMEAFRATAVRYGGSVHFYSLEGLDFSSFYASSIQESRWGKGTLYRLLLQNYVKADKVLYLDCDVIVNLDIAELYALNMRDCIIAAVQDAPVAAKHRPMITWLKKLGIPPGSYFNAGVILIDLVKLRAQSETFQCEITSSLTTGSLTYFDQDALNIFFAKRPGSVLYLDEKYNQQIGYASLDGHIQDFSWYRGKILHFATPKKPWDYFSQSAIQYWKYHALAFPEKNTWHLMEATKQHLFNTQFLFMLRSPKIRSFVRRAHDIATKGLWESIRKRISPS